MSAKSIFISPTELIKSLIDSTACFKTSSVNLNASIIDIFWSEFFNNLSLEITIKELT